MKKCAALLLFFFAGFSLYAQIYRNATIYIPPITGLRSRAGDKNQILKHLTEHLEHLQYVPVRTMNNAAYTLFASVTLLNISTNGTQTHLLHLELMDNKTGRTVLTQDFYYSKQEEIARLIKNDFLLAPFSTEYELRPVHPDTPPIETSPPPAATTPPAGATAPSTTPARAAPPSAEGDEYENPDEWRSKPWYLSAGIFWTPRVYEGDYESTYYVNFGYGIWAEYHFLQLVRENLEIFYYLTVGSGLELVPDWVAVREGESYRDLSLEIPLLVSFAFKPSKHYMLMPYLGINFNIPFYRDTLPPPVAWRVGFQYGVKAGPGILVIDPWFSMDFGKSGLASSPEKYQRYMMHIGVKYKYGFDDFKNFLWFRK